MIDEEFEKTYQILPPSLQDALFDSNNNQKIRTALNLSGIPTEDQIVALLLDMVGEVFLGKKKRVEFSNELIKRSKLSSNQILLLDKIIQKDIFEPLKDSLDSLEKRGPLSQLGSIVSQKIESKTKLDTSYKEQQSEPSLHPIDQILKLRNQTKLAQQASQSNTPDVQSKPEIKTQEIAPLERMTIHATTQKTELPNQIPTRIVNLNEAKLITSNPSKLLSAMQPRPSRPAVLEQIGKIQQEQKTIDVQETETKVQAPIKVPPSEVMSTNRQDFKPITSISDRIKDKKRGFITSAYQTRVPEEPSVTSQPVRYNKPSSGEPFTQIPNLVQLDQDNKSDQETADKIVFDYSKIQMPNYGDQIKENISLPDPHVVQKPDNTDPKIIGNIVDLR